MEWPVLSCVGAGWRLLLLWLLYSLFPSVESGNLGYLETLFFSPACSGNPA